MNILCAPSGIIDIRHPGQGIADIAGAGFENMLLDISMCCSEYELESIGKRDETESRRKLVSEHPDEMYASLEPTLAGLKKARLKCPVAFAPYLCRNTKHTDLSGLLLQLSMESIRLCGMAGCRYLIVRPLYAGIERGEEWEANRAYYLRLAETAQENGVTLLLENQCRCLNGHLVRGICSEAAEAAEWIDSLNKASGDERFGFCINTGTCNLCGQDGREFALALGNRVKAVIVRDCDGHGEASLLPFTCVYMGQPQTDWLGLIRGLRDICFDGALIMDFSDTARAFSPILRPQLVKLAKETAEYFRWQIAIESLLKKYRSVALFGAGNMCRNYMKCYGEKYPPLFTCDNNSSLWGTEFCGLEVKPPDSLKALPEDCAVFICNIYYREIEKQLRGMGIKNPVEFFNDEYMPSFYFDRLKERG